jgi:hypothetical protein
MCRTKNHTGDQLEVDEEAMPKTVRDGALRDVIDRRTFGSSLLA